MKWSKRELDRDEVRAIAARFGCDNLTAHILARRSLGAPEDARFFLEDDITNLHNPYLFVAMEAAVARIDLAISRAEPIHLFGDRDVDGVTALVLLSESLKELGASVQVFMPEGDDEYGLTEKWIRAIHRGGASLVVTVDCGISSKREVALASELGIDCIVTDHHNAPDELPSCVALIDPKAEGSGYPFRDLCGCAVAWKLDWALHYARHAGPGRDVVLLATRPANESAIVEAVRVRNLRVVDTLTESFVPGMLRYADTRLAAFLGQAPVIAYDSAQAQRDLESVFAQTPELSATSLEATVAQVFPAHRGQSLLRILEASKAARYASRPLREIDVLHDLYVAVETERMRPHLGSVLGRLDLVALGTLSDLMGLKGENRILVRRGMELLSSNPRRGLRELLTCQSLLGKRIHTRDIAWKVSPVLNAAGRMGQPKAALDLFLAETMQGAAAQADVLLDLNRQRKALGDKVWDECRADAEASLEKTGGRFLLAAGTRIHWGITGVLAARLAAAFRTPAMVVSVGAQRCIGSVRSPVGYTLAGFLDRFDDLLAGYGGHDYAAGFSLAPERLEAFRERFFAVARDTVLGSTEEETLQIDAELPASYLTQRLATVVDRFEPYGEGNPPLTFLTRDLRVESVELMGKNNGAAGPQHARLLLATGTTRWPAVFWNGAARVREQVSVPTRLDVVYRVEWNHFMNMDNLRLTIVDFAT
jgi:single-stranded-DNA-specific exonuclease